MADEDPATQDGSVGNSWDSLQLVLVDSDVKKAETDGGKSGHEVGQVKLRVKMEVLYSSSWC